MLILSTSLLLFLYKCCPVGQWACLGIQTTFWYQHLISVTVTGKLQLTKKSIKQACRSPLQDYSCYHCVAPVFCIRLREVLLQGNLFCLVCCRTRQMIVVHQNMAILYYASLIPAGRIDATTVIISYCKFVGCKQNHSNTEDTFLKRFGRSRTSLKPTHQLANIWPHELMVVMSTEWVY